jgi:hypothetical protein
MYADTFNQFSSAVNLLTRARVMLPHRLEVFQRDYIGSKAQSWSVGGPGKFISFGAGAVSASTPVNEEFWEWTPALPDGLGVVSIVSSSAAAYDGTAAGSTPIIGSERQAMDWRFSLTDPYAINAIPEAWRDSYALIGGGFVGRYEHYTSVAYATAGEGPSLCDGSAWTIDGTDYEVGQVENTTTACQVFAAGGTLDVGTPASAALWFAQPGATACAGVSEISDGIFPISTATGILTVSLV